MIDSSSGGGDRAPQNDQAGVTLVELMVALSILAVIFTGVAAGLIQATALAREARLRAVATSLAAEELDLIRSRDFDLLAAETVTRDVDAANGTFSVARTSRWITDDSSTDACTAASFDSPTGIRPAFLRVDVDVEWPTQRDGSRPVSTSTIVSPPVEALDPTKGHLAVTVRNAEGDRQAGVEVSAAGPATDTKITDENGCAFFAYVDSGEWDLTLDQSGWVDRQGNLSTSVTEFVNAGEVATIEFSYDRAAALETDLVSAHGAPIAAGLVRTATGPELTVTQEEERFINLFPFPSGYDAWAGCEDNAPYLYSADVVGAAPLPGTTDTLDIPLPTVTVRAEEGTRLRAQSGSTQVQCADPIELGVVERLDEDLYGEDVFGLSVSLPFGPWRFEDADGGDDAWCQTVVLGGDDDGAPEHRDDLVLEADCAPLETPPDEDDPEPDRYFIVARTEGDGEIILDPPGGLYDAGTTVEVTAVPDTGWLFDGWSQDLSGTTNPVLVTLDANTDIT
ncbi:MAG: InlB B-repeat-containing protein, partial [Nitriliruptoraceae bacterium]